MTEMMTADDGTDAKLRGIVIEALELTLTPVQITDETNLFDLGIDSLAVLRLMMAIQDAFGVDIPEDALDASLFERFGNLARAVRAAR